MSVGLKRFRQRQGQRPDLVQQDRQPSYHETTEGLRDDCFIIDAIWLIDHHPELWQRMVLIDLQLTRSEQKGAEEGEYEAMLEKLVQAVRKARALYELEHAKVEVEQ